MSDKNLPPNFKERLFGAYMGCAFIYTSVVNDLVGSIVDLDQVTAAIITDRERICNAKLRLKSLADISLDNALLACKAAYPTSFLNGMKWTKEIDSEYGFITIKCNKSYHSFDIDIKDGSLSFYDGDHKSDMPVDYGYYFDIVRQMGYALPFAGVSVETMVEHGLIELI